MEIALIIGAILEIIILICFFILCSNVSKIRKHLIQNDDFEAKFKFLVKMNEKEKAKEILIDRILSNDDIFNIGINLPAEVKAQQPFNVYADEFAALGINAPTLPTENK